MFATAQTIGEGLKYKIASSHLARKGPSSVLGLDQKQTQDAGFAAMDGRADAFRPQHISAYSRAQSAERAKLSRVLCWLTDALLLLAIAEKRLVNALQENESLQINNEKLMHALDGAARMAVAAQRAAYHDRLTGLSNRQQLIKRVQLAIENAAERHRQLALLFIDLDGFKMVNDRFGHAMADRLLSGVAGRIATCVRADDIACRYGGDEFVVLLTNLNDAKSAIGIAEQIRERIGQRYSIDGKEVCITASIGLAAYPADGERYEVLLDHADASMYCDKASRRGHVEDAIRREPRTLRAKRKCHCAHQGAALVFLLTSTTGMVSPRSRARTSLHPEVARCSIPTRPGRIIFSQRCLRMNGRLVPKMELWPMPLGDVLYKSGSKLQHVYFPTTSIISLLYVMGRISLFMGGETTPSLYLIEEFLRAGSLQRLLLRYTQALITQMSQTAVCNRHHSVEQQLCRWLLMSIDRLPSNELTMTQELIANMLGVRREGVTESAGKLQRLGLLSYNRGHIKVLDRPALEAHACECYSVVKKEFGRLLPWIAARKPSTD